MEMKEKEYGGNGKCGILILKYLILIFIIFYIPVPVSAYERTMPTDGLIGAWHPGGYCISCHYSLTSIEKAQAISYSCECHNYRPSGITTGYKIDMANITNLHKDIMCIRCHIGMKDQNNVSAQDFHRIMPIACNNCHGYINGTIQIPEKKNCSDCHANGNPHVVHGNKVGELCIACHGEDFAKKYSNGTINVTENNVSLQPEVVKEYPTVTDLIDKILQTIWK